MEAGAEFGERKKNHQFLDTGFIHEILVNVKEGLQTNNFLRSIFTFTPYHTHAKNEKCC